MPFKELARNITKSYEKKGVPQKKAEEIGKATAATIERRKYGKTEFAKMGAAGRRTAGRRRKHGT